MALITRISRLFQADLHAVLDQLEEPALLLRQSVRDMEEQLESLQHRIDLLQYDDKQLGLRCTQAESALSRLDEELDLCFVSGNEALAREVIRRKLETEQSLKAIAARREEIGATLREQQTLYRENQFRYESMRQKAELLCEDEMASGLTSTNGRVHGIDDKDVELAFLREKHLREHIVRENQVSKNQTGENQNRTGEAP